MKDPRTTIQALVNRASDQQEKLSRTPGADRLACVRQYGELTDVLAYVEQKMERRGADYDELDLQADRDYIKEHVRRYRQVVKAHRREP